MTDTMKMKGTVVEVLPRGEYLVELENGHQLVGHVSGKMRMHYIKIQKEDKVEIEISRHDLTKGRIVFRDRKKPTYNPNPQKK